MKTNKVILMLSLVSSLGLSADWKNDTWPEGSSTTTNKSSKSFSVPRVPVKRLLLTDDYGPRPFYPHTPYQREFSSTLSADTNPTYGSPRLQEFGSIHLEELRNAGCAIVGQLRSPVFIAAKFIAAAGAAGLGTEALNAYHQAITPEVSNKQNSLVTPSNQQDLVIARSTQDLVLSGIENNPLQVNNENIGANNANPASPKPYMIDPTLVGGVLAGVFVAAAGYGAYKVYKYHTAKSKAKTTLPKAVVKVVSKK